MIENKENYVYSEEEGLVVKSFAILKDGKQIAGGTVGISDDELLKLYETNKELAEKDIRLQALLEPEEPITPEPTQLDRIETFMLKSQEQITQEARDAYTLELINSGII